MEKTISKILVDGVGWVYAKAVGGQSEGVIETFKVNGEMAPVV